MGVLLFYRKFTMQIQRLRKSKKLSINVHIFNTGPVLEHRFQKSRKSVHGFGHIFLVSENCQYMSTSQTIVFIVLEHLSIQTTFFNICPDFLVSQKIENKNLIKIGSHFHSFNIGLRRSTIKTINSFFQKIIKIDPNLHSSKETCQYGPRLSTKKIRRFLKIDLGFKTQILQFEKIYRVSPHFHSPRKFSIDQPRWNLENILLNVVGPRLGSLNSQFWNRFMALTLGISVKVRFSIQVQILEFVDLILDL